MDKWHVLPVGDSKEHEQSVHCDCTPAIRYYENGIIITHNSYDQRELLEINEVNNN